MKVIAISECLKNLRQRRLTKKAEAKKLSETFKGDLNKLVELPATNAIINQLANITYWSIGKNRVDNVYDKTMLKYIGELYKTSPVKAMDMANRLKANVNTSDEYRFPRNWNYLTDIYDNDYDFIEKYFPSSSSLGQIEALHHVKDEISDENEFSKYKPVSARIIYPLLEMRKEYPEQVNEILDNKQYRELFECEKGIVPYSDEMKEFAKFIKNDSETMQKTLDMFKGTNRYYPTNMNSPCNLSEALKYAKLMKTNPVAVTEIIDKYHQMEPELLKVMVNNYDNPYLLEDFDIYNGFVHDIKMRDHGKVNEWEETHYFSVPVKKAVLDDLDKFLKSGFTTRLNDLLVEKGKNLESPDRDKREIAYNLDIRYHRILSENSKCHEYKLGDWLESMLRDRSFMHYSDAEIKRDYMRDILKNDRETFLRLVEDDVLYLYNNEQTKLITKLYKKYPDKQITKEMIGEYLNMDREIAEAFLK